MAIGRRAAAWATGRAVGIVLLGVAVAAGVLGATTTSGWRVLDLKVFDVFSTAAPPARPGGSPLIVAIDEPSLAEIGRQWPWPRDLHARLVEALRAAGAKAVGLDIIFAEPSSEEADAALEAALGPDVVLAGDETVISTPQAEQYVRVEPLPRFQQTGARTGIASVVLDSDGVLRRVPGYVDGFAAALLQAGGRGGAPVIPAGALIQSFGPARSYQTVSYYQALDPAEFLPPGFFRDRVVIVGLSMQSAPTLDAGGADAYATSWTLRSRRLVAGAEIQATIFDNLAGRLFVMPAPLPFVGAAAILGALLGMLAVWRGTGWATAAWALVALALFSAASFLLLVIGRLYLAPLAPSLAFAGVAGIQSARDYAAERRLRRTVTRAFSQYVSPVIVERLAADPRQLRLGGERRILTVLFCDVRGFTTISEQMKDDPEGLTLLVNRLLNPLSDVILKAGGTIDKYIGDAIMAFWNAPLDDPDHAVHAIGAAFDMLAALDRLNAERLAEAEAGGVAPVRLQIGIGINTGACVVGNMGSDYRFNYSALGDAVNLAARLESETKTYGVSILVGEETVSAVAGRLPLAELDRIRVKGKSEVVAVSAPLSESNPALDAHRGLVADLYAGKLDEDDPRFESLAGQLPQLAGYYDWARRRAAEIAATTGVA